MIMLAHILGNFSDSFLSLWQKEGFTEYSLVDKDDQIAGKEVSV